MPVNPVGPAFVNKWNSRVQQAQSAGIPVEVLAPMFQQDIKSLQTGGSGITDQEFALGALSNYNQTPALHPVSHKPNWNPMGLLGRGIKDIGEVGKGIITLPKTIAHDVSHIGEMPGAIAKGASDIGHGRIGQGLQEIAGAPGLQEALLAASFLIPGGEAATAPLRAAALKTGAGVLAGGVAGEALTPEGRKQISQHPGIALVNVLPALSEAGVTHAAAQAIHESAVGKAVGKVTSDLGIDPRSREVWRTFSDARKRAHTAIGGFWDQANEMFGRHTPEMMAKITKTLRSGSPEAIAEMTAIEPKFAEMKASYDSLQAAKAQANESMVHLPGPGGVTDVYPVSSLPARAWAAWNGAKDRLAPATETLADRARKLAEARDRVNEVDLPDPKAIMESLKPEMEREIASMGFDSPLAKAVERMRREDYAGAARVLKSTGKYDYGWPKHEVIAQIENIKPGMEEYAKANQALQDAERSHARAQATQDQLARRVKRKERQFHEWADRMPPARWVPNVNDAFPQLAHKWAQDFYSGDPARLNTAVKEISAGYLGGTFEDGTPIFPVKELRKIEKDAVAQIDKWRKAGWDPSYVHAVTESQVKSLLFPQVARRTEPRISANEMRKVGTREEVDNVALSLTHQQAEVFVNQQWNDIWHGYDGPNGHYDGLLSQWGRTQGDFVKELRARGATPQDAIRQFNAEWENPSRFTTRPDSVFNASNNVHIPKSLARNLDKLRPSLEPGGHIKAAFDKGTRGFRFAVTGLSPQHMVHIMASGAVMFGMAMNDLPAVMRSVGEARSMIKEGRVPVRFTQEASMLSDEEALTFGAATRSANRLYVDSVTSGLGKAAHPLQKLNAAIQHFDDHVTQWYKTLDYVAQTKRGLDPERALVEVGKHFADHAGRSPIERAIFKTYVPFGSWTQHLIRYAFGFPADHPLRAGILANLATAEFEDQNTGLPRDFAQLFFHGKEAFDIRSFNPFRDIGRNLTLAGFISSLHPGIQAIFQSKGYNPITDSAELYPELRIDPNTGKVITKGSNFFQNLGEAMVPQVQGIEALLGWSDQMRTLKKNDPKAYASTLARYLHFPWLPKDVNIPQVRTKEQINQLRLAQGAVTKAMKTGDFSGIESFNVVPFRGKLVPPKTLEAIYAMARKVQPNFPANVTLR